MSGISSVGSSGSLPFLISPTSVLDPADDATAAATDAPVSSPVGQDGASTVAAPSPLADLRSQIETAVTASVSQLPAGSSPQDIFNAVRSAVEDTLKANGLDPGQVAGHRGGHHHHASGAGADASADPGGDASQQPPTDPLLAALQTTSGPANKQPPGGGVLAIFASGPGALDALTSLVQQLNPAAAAQAGSGDGHSQPASSLLATLQGSSANSFSLTAVFQQLFQSFPNGTGLDVQA